MHIQEPKKQRAFLEFTLASERAKATGPFVSTALSYVVKTERAD